MQEPQENVHFLDYWRVLKSRKELVIAVALFVVAVGVTVTFMLPRVYMAKTRVSIKEPASEVPVFSRRDLDGGYYDPFFLKTQQEIIESQYVLADVIQNLKLREVMSAALGRELSAADTRRWLQRSLKVRPYLDTNILEIEVYMSEPKDRARVYARDIANEIVRVYEQRMMEDKRRSTRRGVDAIHDAFVRQKELVAKTEQELEELRRKSRISVMGGTPGTSRAGATLDAVRLQQSELARIAARRDMFDRKAKLDKLQELEGDARLVAAMYLVGDPALSALRRRKIDTQLDLKNLLANYGEEHPRVLAQKAVLEQMEKEIDEAVKGAIDVVETDYEIAEAELAAVEKDLEAVETSGIDAEAERYLPFRKKEEELEQQRKIRDALEMRWIQERIEMDLPKTPLKVIDWAEVPRETEPVKPSLYLNLALSILLGLGGGIGLAFFIEYLDTSVKTVDDIEKFIGAQVLGVIPQRVRPLVETGMSGLGAEAYRVLRTNIRLSEKLGRDMRVLCVTSGGVGEGKSLTVANLAFVSAQLGDRTLVVDSDTRRPRQHKIFNISNRRGLTGVLTGDLGIDEAIVSSIVPNLDILPSGRLRTASSGVVDSDRLRAVTQELKTRYDIVLLDSPPILGVSDASILVSVVDGVLLIVQHRAYPRMVPMRAKNMIENIGGRLIGIVLNNINVARDYYYYYYTGYGRYGRYGYGYGYGARQQAADRAEEEAETAAAATEPKA